MVVRLSNKRAKNAFMQTSMSTTVNHSLRQLEGKEKVNIRTLMD